MKKSSRERDITHVSIIGVVANAVLGVVKIIVGYISGSVAIITDAVNSLTDTSSSIITIAGTHLAGRRPDAKHPFGYGRIEYLTSLIIGLIVFFTGVEMCRSSIESIIHPKPVHMTLVAVIVLVVTLVVKLLLGQYTLRAGRRLDSGALVASGLDARTDSVATAAALFAALMDIILHVSIDAWVGALISLFIIYTGFSVLKDTVSKIVGESISADITTEIRRMVNADPMVIGAYDLILNGYGPNKYIGSMNVEVDRNLTADKIYKAMHALQRRVERKLHVFLVFGIYAVDKSDPQTAAVSKVIEEFCSHNKHCLGFHGVLVDEESHEIFCDIVLDFQSDHEAIKERLHKALLKDMPGYTPVINVDIPFTSSTSPTK